MLKNTSKFGTAYWGEIRRKSFEKTKLKKASVKERLKVYFSYWLKNSTFVCEECGASINKYDSLQAISAICHIVPKNTIESVCDHLDNHMTLCMQHHQDFDSSYSKAMTMRVWEIAKQRFQKFAHLITDPHERRRLPEELQNLCNP